LCFKHLNVISQPYCFLIDDDLDDQDLFCYVLNEIDPNIRCEVANSGEEALDRFQAHPQLIPDFIFIDVNLVLMNGFVCLKELKKFNQLAHSKMIMYSTNPDEKLRSQSIELGALQYIVKSPHLQQLKEQLSRIILGLTTENKKKIHQPD
jgi:DNA-binding response OmpR family regulator